MIGLINWSGHGNLGDDAMVKILVDYFSAVNMRENPQKADWYILGGGTLISPKSLFLNILPEPEKTIIISIGVSSDWGGEWVEILKKIKRIYTRDFFSHNKLKEYGVESILSVDLLCFLQQQRTAKRVNTYVNFVYPKEYEVVNNFVGKAKYFALSKNEDMETMKNENPILYTDAQELLNDLADAKTIYATRLHACVLAWLSGCKDIKNIPYDKKIIHFQDRVKNLTPEKARQIIKNHLDEINAIFIDSW